MGRARLWPILLVVTGTVVSCVSIIIGGTNIETLGKPCMFFAGLGLLLIVVSLEVAVRTNPSASHLRSLKTGDIPVARNEAGDGVV